MKTKHCRASAATQAGMPGALNLTKAAIARESQTKNDMKRTLFDNRNKAGQSPGARGRTAAWLVGLALAAAAGMNGTSVFAEVYDDFENPTRSMALWTRTVWYGTGGQTVSNGQVRIYVTPTGNHAFSFLQSVRRWTLREGHTLEFRADLLSSNDDGAVAFFGFNLGDGNNGYRLFVDEDTLIMHKRSSPGVQCFFWTNGAPVKVSNVKLVVSMTGTKSAVLLKFRILDNDNAGAVIIEREFWDTAAADPMQVGSDNPPESYLGQSGYFYVGLYHDNAGVLDPEVTLPHLGEAEVVYDNAEVFEYDVPSLDIAKSVLLSWSPNTEEEQIVVMADSLTSTTWTPCPAPIFTGSGGLSITVPITQSQQFFKLVPGRQFADDFSDTSGPFTNRSCWRLDLIADPGYELIVTNGVLRLNWQGPSTGGCLAQPPGPDFVVGDFCLSVDVLDWVTSTTNYSRFGLVARGPHGAGLLLNDAGVPGRLIPWMSYGGTVTNGVPFDISAYPPPYHLEFSGVGTKLSLRVLNLTTREIIREMSWRESHFDTTIVGLWQIDKTGVPGSHTITVDNFFASVTKP
jgi:hypothetical protein